jgi:hypothetical protein
MERTFQRSSLDTSSITCGQAAEGCSQGSGVSARFEHLPKELGFLLLATGMVTGMLPPPPGPFDMSIMLAGGVALWPRGFRALDGWTQRRFPKVHRASMSFLERYLNDLEHRYPGSTVWSEQAGAGSPRLPGLSPRR